MSAAKKKKTNSENSKNVAKKDNIKSADLKEEKKDTSKNTEEISNTKNENNKEKAKAKAKENISESKKETTLENKEKVKNSTTETKKSTTKKKSTSGKKKGATKKKTTSTNKGTKTKKENLDDSQEKKKIKEKNEPEENSKGQKPEEIKAEEEKKEIVVAPPKEITQTDEKPEYVQEMIKKRKIRKGLTIAIIVAILFLIIISTVFAIINMNNSNIIKGISVKNIDISNLSKEDSINKLTEAMNKELIAEIDLKFGNDYSVTLKPEQIEFEYKIEETVENAYLVGREGNVVIDNYSIILANLLGREVKIHYAYNGELLNQFVEDINSKLPGVVVEPTYYIEEEKLFVNKGTDGIRVKKDELKNQIIQAILERKASEMTDGFTQTIEIPAESVEASEIDMQKIYSEIYREPQDAYYETEPYKIYPDVDGIDLTISVEEAQNMIAKENNSEYVFDLKITEAEKTLDELGTEAFPYLISQSSTKYDASNRNRSTNLELAAEKINGKVLMPGEEFSFNKIVGKRTVEDGYKDAKIYADGGVVDGLAGGICQISSTLYNSVLLANLQITERRNHSFTTSYLPAGKDATVVWGTTDFRFINSRSYPIKIEATVSNGIAEFKIHGMQEETEYEVRILPVRTQSIPYSTTYEEDPTLLPGQQIIKQSGHAGCKVTTYKELRLNGEVVSKEPISNDTYQPMRTIIRVALGHIPVTQ